MQRSTDRLLTTHAGSLPRPDDLLEMVTAKSRGQAVDEEDLRQRLRRGIAKDLSPDDKGKSQPNVGVVLRITGKQFWR